MDLKLFIVWRWSPKNIFIKPTQISTCIFGPSIFTKNVTFLNFQLHYLYPAHSSKSDGLSCHVLFPVLLSGRRERFGRGRFFNRSSGLFTICPFKSDDNGPPAVISYSSLSTVFKLNVEFGASKNSEHRKIWRIGRIGRIGKIGRIRRLGRIARNLF